MSLKFSAGLMLLIHCHGAQLTIRVVDAKTTRPVSHDPVEIAFSNRKDNGHIAGLVHLRAKTDSRGMAMFELDPDLHPFICVDSLNQCSPSAFYAPEILRKGRVAGAICWHDSKGLNRLTAGPGELVLYRDSLNLFERLTHTKGVW